MTNPTEQILEALKTSAEYFEYNEYEPYANKMREAFAAMQGKVLVDKEPLDQAIQSGISLALSVTLSGEYKWNDYMRDLYTAMVAPYVNKEEG